MFRRFTTECWRPHPVRSKLRLYTGTCQCTGTYDCEPTYMCARGVCNTYLLDQCMNYGCPVATTRQPLEPLWLDVGTTDAVYETPALPPSGMCKLHM